MELQTFEFLTNIASSTLTRPAAPSTRADYTVSGLDGTYPGSPTQSGRGRAPLMALRGPVSSSTGLPLILRFPTTLTTPSRFNYPALHPSPLLTAQSFTSMVTSLVATRRPLALRRDSRFHPPSLISRVKT